MCPVRAIFMIETRTYTRRITKTSRREGAGPRYNLTPGGYFFSVESFGTLESYRAPYTYTRTEQRTDIFNRDFIK
jgi:hypothetical protein